jgi:hypothetical protein
MMNAASIRPAVGSRFQELTSHDGQTQTGAQRGQADHDADGKGGGALNLGEIGQDGEVHGFLRELWVAKGDETDEGWNWLKLVA